MSQYMLCDGCGAEVGNYPALPADKKERLITGSRVEGSGGGPAPLPSGRFDWCKDCTLVAFRAVRAFATRSGADVGPR
jgi:hypothetical protein